MLGTVFNTQKIFNKNASHDYDVSISLKNWYHNKYYLEIFFFTQYIMNNNSSTRNLFCFAIPCWCFETHFCYVVMLVLNLSWVKTGFLPQTHDPSVSASSELGLQVCTTMPWLLEEQFLRTTAFYPIITPLFISENLGKKKTLRQQFDIFWYDKYQTPLCFWYDK